MTTPILHHYWGSPYAEKIRVLLGYKDVSWRSAEIPVTPPRVGLTPILGSFRRTPVFQLGADYFCDSRLIAEAIDQLAPTPRLATTENSALSELLCGWVEPRVFALLGPTRFQTAADVDAVFCGQVSVAAFSADRLPFMEPVYDAARYPKLWRTSHDHVSRYLITLEALLATGSPFIGGERPTHGDFSAYHTIWWLRCPPVRRELLAPFPVLACWADRIAKFGHGSYTSIGPEETLALAAAASAAPPWRWRCAASHDERFGSPVAASPDDYGKAEIRGTLIDACDRHVTLERQVEGIGTVRVHFPRLGYEITAD